MKEIRDIILAGERALQQGKQVALATVVHVEGSSYRRPGARMLITEDGMLTGAISGGCLEGDALRKALLVMTQQKPMLVTYDTMDDDDAKFGVGLGCNGIIQVLIEPIQPGQENNPLQLLQILAGDRHNAVLVTAFSLDNKKDPQQGTCILVKENGLTIEGKNEIQLKDLLLSDARSALETRTSAFKNYAGTGDAMTAFIEVVPPSVSLVIIGAGNDVMPLVSMADILGWESTVVDGRPAYAKQERFVSACQVLVSKPENVLSQLAIDEQTVFLLMTHNYNYDMAMLKELVKRDLVYVGMLGPTKKLQRMLNEMSEENIHLDERQRAMIHSPVGLDIGAETPEEIALSILAEIKAVLAGRQGKSLKGQPSSIHSRNATTIEEVRVTSNL
ncbi:MAG: XdhC family protein [Ferruginibacter sp.]|nr:XdhC family protein [Ferruginibacter sp.]